MPGGFFWEDYPIYSSDPAQNGMNKFFQKSRYSMIDGRIYCGDHDHLGRARQSNERRRS